MTTPPVTKPQFAGMSILERCWQELDDIMDQIMEEGEPEVDPAKQPTTAATRYRQWGELRGQAQGVAYCIAMISNPYEPDLPAIKREAKQRWDERSK